MEEEMALNTSRAASGASPLWIIALFIALSEVTAGVAAITTDGAARLIFAIFAVSFPVVVLTCFAWLLVAHTPKLYPPDQYSNDISPERFAAGVRTGISKDNFDFLGHVMLEALVDSNSIGGSGERTADEAKSNLIERFEASARERAITVDLSAIAKGAPEFLFPADDVSTVSDLLNNIYFALAPNVGPFEYLSSWVLRREDGEILDQVRSGREALEVDMRTLTDVGIEPGERLVVEPLKNGRLSRDGRRVRRPKPSG
jgi:hypothetical protein